jgi:hypothetical protein
MKLNALRPSGYVSHIKIKPHSLNSVQCFTKEHEDDRIDGVQSYPAPLVSDVSSALPITIIAYDDGS